MRILLLTVIVLLYACEIKVGTGANKPALQEAPGGKIRNGVEIETTGGVSVEQAYLTKEDGSLVNADNVVAVNEPVKLNLVIDGWKDNGGKLLLDAEQKVTTSDGDIILHKKNMFESVGAISAEDAKYIKFQVEITRTPKLYDYFLVEVLAKNKEFNQSFAGSFKIRL